ncbi:MAG: hypothetical protein ACKVP7_26160 [Hyphomicrobiaceae bacterium]
MTLDFSRPGKSKDTTFIESLKAKQDKEWPGMAARALAFRD